MTRARKWMLGIGTALAVLVVVCALALTWLLHTTAGLDFALARGVAATHGQFGYASASGTLAGTTSLNDIRYKNTDGTTLRIDHAMLELQPWALLGKRLHVRRARIDGIALDIEPSPSPQPASGNPLQPPLTIALDDIVLTRIAIAKQHQPVFAADSLALAATWSKRELVLHKLSLRAPAGSIDLDGHLATTPDHRGSANATLDWTQAGTRYRGTLVADADGKAARLEATLTAPVRATLHATLAQDAAHAWTLALAAPQFNAHALPRMPAALKTLALDLHGAGDAHGGKLTGAFTANDHAVMLDPAQFRYAGQTLTLDPLRLRSSAMAGVATLTGKVEFATAPSAALDLDWQGVQLPADLVGQPLATHGKLHVAGNSDAYRVQGALALGPPGRLADVQVDLSGTRERIQLHTLQLVQAQGGFDATGTIDLQPKLTWKLDASATRFDPGAIFVGWNGALTFKLATQGGLTPHGPAASIKLTQASGTLRGQRIDGSTADAFVTPGNWLAGTLDLIVGNSHLRASGKPGPNTNTDLDLDVASLGAWWPGATGALRGQFNIKGVWPKLAVSGHLAGSKLGLDGRSIDSLQLQANVPNIAQPGGALDLMLAGVRANGFDFKNVHLVGSGSAAAHRLQLTASGAPLGIRATLQGSLPTPGGAWRGSLSEVELAPQGMPAWRQTQASALAWKDGNATLARLCLSAGAPRLCLAGARDSNGAISATYDLQKLPLQLLATLAGGTDPLLASGDVSGSGKLTLTANGALGGGASLATSAGQLAFASSANQPLLAWNRISAAATATGGDQHLALSGMLADGGHINGDINLRGNGALGGTLVADLRSLAFISALSPEVANVKGGLTGTLQLGGTLAAPQFQGRIQTHDFSAELPRAGLKLHDGTFAVTGDPQGRLAISGNVASGTGVLHVDGSTGLAAGAPLQLAIKGDDVLVADIPAAHVVASPDLHLAHASGAYTLTGSITIPNAAVEAEKLPGQGPTAASPDVVIVDAPPAAPVKPLALDAEIVVKLGDAVKLHGYGLDGGVGGQLTITAKPGSTATARGQISVSGKYQAYGQDLDIERGRLLFAGTRLDNPGLDIRAVRKIQGQGITVGLAVRGTAQQPQLTVFSEPAMEQAEALSYLVTGRSMETLKSGEGDTLNTAAQALGGLAGDRLAKSIGSRLGIEAGVSSNAALGGTAFTAGKYLSPRLFLSYGVGLFTPGQVITLRYTLNRFLQFEAESATTGNRASLNYRIEK